MQLWEYTAIEEPERARRRVRNGQPTNELAFSAYVGGNEDTFPHVLDLYVAPGSLVADVTFGKGVFWRNVPEERYELLATDIFPRVLEKRRWEGRLGSSSMNIAKSLHCRYSYYHGIKRSLTCCHRAEE